MSFTDIELLKTRVDVLETQHAVMAGLVSMLLQLQVQIFPKNQKDVLLKIHEDIFEKTISNLLANEVGFSDASVQAIERLKKEMLENLKH